MRLQEVGRSRKAFTLLELIVVIVILGILAALAIPTFGKVIENSKDKTTLAALESFGREVLSLKAFNPERTYSDAAYTNSLLEDAGDDLPGEGSGDDKVNNSETAPYGDVATVNYWVVQDGEFDGDLVLSKRSSSGNVSAVLIEEGSSSLTSKIGVLDATTPVITLFTGEEGPVDPPESGSLSAPANFQSSLSGSNAELTWTPVSGAASYSLIINGTPAVSVSGGSTSSYSTPVALGSNNTFQVAAVSSTGTVGEYASSTLTVGVPQPTWAFVAASPARHNVIPVTLTKPSGINNFVAFVDGVEVERRDATWSPNVGSWEIELSNDQLTPGQSYTVGIAAILPDGTVGDPFERQVVVAPGSSSSTAPSVSAPFDSQLASQGKARVAWTAVPGAERYAYTVDGTKNNPQYTTDLSVVIDLSKTQQRSVIVWAVNAGGDSYSGSINLGTNPNGL